MARIRVMEMIDRPFLGGGQVTVLNLARGLDRGEFDPFVVSAAGGALDEALRAEGIAHLPIEVSRASIASTVAETKRIIEARSPDILHTHGGVAGLVGRLAARRGRPRAVVHTLHGIHYLHYGNPAARAAMVLLERRLSRRTGAVVTVSRADRSEAERRRLAPPEKLRLIRNGLDLSAEARTDAAAVKAEVWGGAAKRRVVGAVSRLHRQKGLVHLVRAAPLVRAIHPDVLFAVVGGGPLEASLRSEIRKQGLESSVLLLGERADARRWLASFDVFVLPSLWEGLPYALGEAGALAKPIVATDIDGVREVVSDRANGRLVPPGDAEALARALIEVLGDPEGAARMGAAARETIPPLFSLPEMLREHARLYRELL